MTTRKYKENSSRPMPTKVHVAKDLNQYIKNMNWQQKRKNKKLDFRCH